MTPGALAANGLLAICLAQDAACLKTIGDLHDGREIAPTEVTLRREAWGHLAAPYNYVVTVIPPRT